MSSGADRTELRPKNPWKYFGKWAIALVLLIFLPFVVLLAVEGNMQLLVVWVVLLLFAEVLIFLMLGPFYRPRIGSVLVKEIGLFARYRDGSEFVIAFRDISRISSGSASSAVILNTGKKHILGFGFGGSQGDAILQAHRAWAQRNGIGLREYKTPDVLPGSFVTNVAVVDAARE